MPIDGMLSDSDLTAEGMVLDEPEPIESPQVGPAVSALDRGPTVSHRTGTEWARQIYTRRTRYFFAALLVGVGGFGAAVFSATAMDSHNLGQWTAAGVFTLLTLSSVLRVMRMSLVVSPGEVVIRNFFTSTQIAAAEVARFDPPPRYGSAGPTGLRVVLRSGRVLSAHVFAHGKLDKQSVGHAEAEELNAWLGVPQSQR